MSDSIEEQSSIEEAMQAPVPRFESSSVGARLARAREQRGWTVQYVAEQLKLSQTQIFALESDQFEKLPKLVIVRGFVRAYAKLLRVDATELMQLMPQDMDTVALETSLRPALATPFIEPRASLTGQQENNKRYVIGILVLLILVALILFLQRTDYGQQMLGVFSNSERAVATVDAPTLQVASVPELNSAPASSATSTMVASPVEQAASNVQESASTAGVSDVQATPGSVTATSASNATTSKLSLDAPKTEVPAAASSPEKSSSEKASPSAKSDRLVLKFKHDSWLFVKANGGAVLTSRMVRAGAEEIFDVKQGLFVKIGNATDVEASLRGERLTVTTERDSKVATLSVK